MQHANTAWGFTDFYAQVFFLMKVRNIIELKQCLNLVLVLSLATQIQPTL